MTDKLIITPDIAARIRATWGERYFDENCAVMEILVSDEQTQLLTGVEELFVLRRQGNRLVCEPLPEPKLPAGNPKLGASWADRRAHLMKGKR